MYRRVLFFVRIVYCCLVLASPAMAILPCKEDIPDELAYRPSMSVCYGNAAIIFRGSLKSAFSVVVRDGNNNDMNPSLPNCEYSWCSPYKVHKVVESDGEKINCLGMSGSSEMFKAVRRITVKTFINGKKNIDRYCLRSATESIH